MGPQNLCRNSIGMWQRSKQDLIDRSANAFNNSKNRYQQSTINAWNNSKSRCQRSTMGMWHKSTDTWVNSKERCHQSAKGMVERSISKWNESADQMHQAIRVQQANEAFSKPQQTKDATSSPSSPPSAPPSSPESTKSTTRFYSQSTNSSPTCSSAAKAPSSVAGTPTLQSTSLAGPSLSPIEEIRSLHDTISTSRSVAKQTKQLRDDRGHILGEIELEWINSTITEADKAVNDLSAIIKPYWAKQSKKPQMTTSDRKNWARRDYQHALKRQSRLLLCHSKLQTVLEHLESLPKELTVTSTEFKDVESLTPLGLSELSATGEISVAELSAESTLAELPVPVSIPRIIVTQYDNDNDNDEVSSLPPGSPPPSYEMSEIRSVKEVR